MKSKWYKFVCTMAVIGLLITTHAFAASGDVYSGLKQLKPQLSADGNTLYNGGSAVVVVVDPTPPENQVNILPPDKMITEPGKATATFAITYVASGGADPWGQACLTFPEEAKAAFNAAAAIWGNSLKSSVPIKISACWANLGSSSILGYSGGQTYYRNFAGAPKADTWYDSSLANALHGSALNSTGYDMYITYNQNFSWYMGTDGNTPTDQIDLESVILHEIAHGLNFSGSMSYTSGTGSWGGGTGFPVIYDTFMRDGTANPGNQLINTGVYPNPSTALGSALKSENIWFHGSNAMAANGGQRVKMFAPATWMSGSSYSHLDYTTFSGGANRLMVYAISSGVSTHDPGPVTMGLLKDLGWPYPTPSGGAPLYASFANKGIWQWTGSGWTKLTPDNPAGMVASGTNLYGNFTGNGIWKWTGSDWTKLTPDNPTEMAASGTNLYGNFTGNGIWKWTGSGWIQLTPDNPASMVASGTNLYGNFTGNGIWQWTGSAWTRLTPDNPASMVASGTNLYGNFTGNGIWQWTGSAWTKLTPDNPTSMAASGSNLYVNFPTGIWQWNGSVWSQLTPDSPAIMATGDSDTQLGVLDNWEQLAGVWTSDGTNFSTNGLDGFFASISYKPTTFSDVDFTARLYRDSSITGYANSLYLRGTPAPLDRYNTWNKGYLFEYTMSGYYSVWRCNGDGTVTALQDWTESSAINTGADWNTIRAVASGTALSLYINGTPVWTGTDATWNSGQIGISMYSGYGSTGNVFRVQQASLSAGAASSQAGVISGEQAALNNAPVGGGNVTGTDNNRY